MTTLASVGVAVTGEFCDLIGEPSVFCSEHLPDDWSVHGWGTQEGCVAECNCSAVSYGSSGVQHDV